VLLVGDRRRRSRRETATLGFDMQAASPAQAAALLGRVPVAALVLSSTLAAAERRALRRRVQGMSLPDRPLVMEAATRREGWAELLSRLRSALDLRALAADVAGKDTELRLLQGRLDTLVTRMTEELRLAGAVQRSLLPAPVEYAGLEVAREFIPVREVGGDYYDFVPLGPDRVAFALGDVMGKGIPAALLASSLKAAVRAQLQPGHDPLAPEEVVGRVSRIFRDVAPPTLFASLFFAVFDLARGEMAYVNAGHDHPFRVGPDGEVDVLARGGTVLGLVDEPTYESGWIALRRDDLLVFFTDGITDRMDATGLTYDAGRLMEAARRSRGDAARIVLYSLLGDVQGFSEGTPAQDDATLVVVRVR
jgi:sigma-B regulation protein RsbU (phosphoserine phosphatase)